MGANLIPFAGGAIAQLVTEVFPRDRQRRQITFLRDLAEELGRISEALDEDFIRSEDFGELVEDVVERASRARERKKAKYYRALLARCATTRRERHENVRYRVVDTLEAIRESHIRLLAVVARTSRVGYSSRRGFPVRSDLATYLRPSMPDKTDAIRGSWDDLARLGVLTPYPSAPVHRDELALLHLRLTSFGSRFVSHLALGGTEREEVGDDTTPSDA